MFKAIWCFTCFFTEVLCNKCSDASFEVAFLFSFVLGIEPRASYMQGKCSPIELHLQLSFLVSLIVKLKKARYHQGKKNKTTLVLPSSGKMNRKQSIDKVKCIPLSENVVRFVKRGLLRWKVTSTSANYAVWEICSTIGWNYRCFQHVSFYDMC